LCTFVAPLHVDGDLDETLNQEFVDKVLLPGEINNSLLLRNSIFLWYSKNYKEFHSLQMAKIALENSIKILIHFLKTEIRF
jgi:hypothetical protein